MLPLALRLAPLLVTALVLASPGQTQTSEKAALDAAADSLRVRTHFVLQRLDGAPWAGAELRLAGVAHATEPWLSAPDVVHGKSDERGRLVLQLLAGRTYGGYACEPLGDERLRVSRELTDVRAGRLVSVPEEGCVHRPQLQFGGFGPLGALQCVVRGTHGEWGPVRFEVGDGAVVPAPAWPELDIELQHEGHVLHAIRLPWRSETVLAAQGAKPLFAGVHKLTRIRLRVLAPNGNPVAGAEILDELGGGPVRIGQTGDDGWAEILAARGLVSSRGTSSFATSWIVRHPSYPELDLRERAPAQLEPATGTYRAEITAQLHSGSPRRLRVLRPGGAPWPGLLLFARHARPRSQGKPSYLGGQTLRTDANGEAVLQLASTERPVRLFAIPAPDELAALVGPIGAAAPAPLLWLADGPLPEETEFATSALVPLQIQVRGDGGLGAADASLVLEGAGTAQERGAGLRGDTSFTTGRSGRAIVLVHPQHGGPHHARAFVGFASAGTAIEELDRTYRLELPPQRRVTGELRLKGGAPARFAQIYAHWQSAAGGQGGRELRPLRSSVRLFADDRGRFELFAPRDSRLRLSAVARTREGEELVIWSSSNVIVDVPPGDENTALRQNLELDQKPVTMRKGAVLRIAPAVQRAAPREPAPQVPGKR